MAIGFSYFRKDLIIIKEIWIMLKLYYKKSLTYVGTKNQP